MANIILTQTQLDSVISAINNRAKLSGATFTGAVSGTTFTGTSFNGITGMTSTATDIKMNGTQSAGALATVARADHVHPSDTAKLNASQTLALTGDATATATALSTGSLAVTLANSGVTAGTYKSVTVDAKGRVTAGTNPTTLSGYGITDAINASAKGVANGVATLDVNGLVPSTQLPSYVDDVLEYSTLTSFPAIGETGKIYVTQDTNKIYRWSGSAYIEISSAGVADTATKLATARTFQTNLGSLTSASFDGSANVTPGISGTLGVANGGTGATTLTGLVKGNGTGAMTAAVAGTDYVIPSGSITGNAATATNISGGSAGTILYQSAANTTAMLAAGTSGYFLKCNGASAPSWVSPKEMVALTDLSDTTITTPTSGQVLTYDGTAWVNGTASSGGGGGSIAGVFYESSAILSTNYTVTTGSNSMAAGPITVADNITITIPNGSVLTIV